MFSKDVTFRFKKALYGIKAFISSEGGVKTNDSEIVDLYLQRDETAISHTAEKYGVRLRRIAGRILGNDASAEECENDTYLKAWGLIPPNEPRTYLFAFLGKIIIHLAIDECRKKETKKRYAEFCALTHEMEECIPGNSNVEEALNAAALKESINRFLSLCSETQQKVFVRRYWYFDPISEIGKKYGFSENRVKVMLFRMREELKELLREEGYTL